MTRKFETIFGIFEIALSCKHFKSDGEGGSPWNVGHYIYLRTITNEAVSELCKFIAIGGECPSLIVTRKQAFHIEGSELSIKGDRKMKRAF